MFPTIKQFRRWSLPAKYSFVALIFGIISLIPLVLGLRNWLLAVPDYASIAYNYGSSEMIIYGAEGKSTDDAVIIRGADSHEAGVRAEYYWIKRRYPGYRKRSQAVYESSAINARAQRVTVTEKNTGVKMELDLGPPPPPRRYDVIRISNWYGRSRNIHFDINSFFGNQNQSEPEQEVASNTVNDLVKAVDEAKEKQNADKTR